MYENCTAGCSSARLTQEKPAVRVEAASKKPFNTLSPAGRLTTGFAWSCQGGQILLRTSQGGNECQTYIQDDKEHNIESVHNDQEAKEPPGGAGWKQQSETATGMIEQEPQLLVDTRVDRDKVGEYPDHAPKHDREPGVAEDDEKAHQQQRPGGSVERVHAVWGQGIAQVHECRTRREECPPCPADAGAVHDACPWLRVENPWKETNEAESHVSPEIDT